MEFPGHGFDCEPEPFRLRALIDGLEHQFPVSPYRERFGGLSYEKDHLETFPQLCEPQPYLLDGARKELARVVGDIAQAARERIETLGWFHSDKDRDTGHRLLNLLEQRAAGNFLNLTTYRDAVQALEALIPVGNGHGKRQIDGKTIPPAWEQRIASRLQSTEVDVAAPDGSWGRLPEAVKQHLTYHGSELQMELTSNCTVGCSFCGLADKGPIATKASFDSVLEVVQYFAEHQKVNWMPGKPRRLDSLYFGTDPFDVKWAATDATPERDYADLATAYDRIVAGKNRILGTSTAVPLGEEFRVLNFALESLDFKTYAPRLLRLSITKPNARRVGHIQTILKAFPYSPLSLQLSANDVREYEASRGKPWPTGNASNWDIMGPECRDGVIIGVKEVSGIMMQGASEERPNGGPRWPIESEFPTASGGRRYSVPRFYAKPEAPFFTYAAADIYPPTIIDHIDVAADGTVQQTAETLANDPHRALVRLAIAYAGFLGQPRSETVRLRFTSDYGNSLTVLRDYLAGGAVNPTMQGMLNRLVQQGLIEAS